MYKISYTGDGIIASFAFAFPFFQTADVRVSINNEIQNPASYNVNPVETMDGGTITFAVPPIDGAIIDIFRKIHLERFIDYQTTAKLDVERLNDDFNFLLEAFRDISPDDIDFATWQNIHDSVLRDIAYTKKLITDKIGGDDTLGLYKNLLAVLVNALPQLINDYGNITESAPVAADDYGEIK